VRLFDKNGQLLTLTSLNLASPSGYLAGLTSGDVDVWVEGMHKAGDLVVKYALVDQNGVEISRDTVHMQIAQWSFVGKDGNAISSVEEDSLQLLQDELTSDPKAPQAADDVYYKIKLDGLTPGQVGSLNVQSDTTTADLYSDTLVTNGTAPESANWGVIYNTPDDNSDLTSAQILELQKLDAVNAVRDGKAIATLATAADSVSRSLDAKSSTYTSQDLYNWLTSDPNYGDKVKFVLDRMDFQDLTDSAGNLLTDYWKQRLIVQPMELSQGVGPHISHFNIYIPTGLNPNDAQTAALNGLREWLAYGMAGLTLGAKPDSTNLYGASIARQYARSLYWQLDTFVPYSYNNTDVPVAGVRGGILPGVRGANPYYGDAPGTPSTIDPAHRSDAAAVSLALTFDFLEFFSDYGAADWNLPYAVSTYSRETVTSVYYWIFANEKKFAYRNIEYAVSIPSRFGINSDYFEANQSSSQANDLYHDTTHVYDPRYLGGRITWPDEDQLHHFAAYLAVMFNANSPGLFGTNADLQICLHQTGDAVATDNPGDYYLGIVGWDLGWKYMRDPQYLGGLIYERVHESK
jgi:hypothetical protein